MSSNIYMQELSNQVLKSNVMNLYKAICFRYFFKFFLSSELEFKYQNYIQCTMNLI